jgi:hypothetical protein
MSTNPALNTIVSTINTLTRSTYEQWCFKCKIELGKTLYDLVTGETDPPDENDSAETLAAFEVAMRILIPSIVEPEFQLIRNCETAIYGVHLNLIFGMFLCCVNATPLNN